MRLHGYTVEDQYMFGEDILFAPILDQGQTQRSVYLPEGNWVRVYDGTTYTGKQSVTVHAEIEQYIAFTKAGSEVLSVF